MMRLSNHILADRPVLYSRNSPVQTFAPGRKVLLNVTNSGLHGVTWYHNRTEIKSSDRISATSTQLAIHQAVTSDAGVYQLRITSLFLSCNESSRSGEWFHLLENLAAYAPVTFILQDNDQGIFYCTFICKIMINL